MSPSRALLAVLALGVALAWEAGPWGVLPGGARLDLMLVWALVAGLWGGPWAGAGVGLLAGGLADLVVGAGLAQGLSKAMVGAAAGVLRPVLVRLDLITALAVGAVGSLLDGLLSALWWQLADRSGAWATWAEHALPLALAHGLLVGAWVGWGLAKGWLPERAGR